MHSFIKRRKYVLRYFAFLLFLITNSFAQKITQTEIESYLKNIPFDFPNIKVFEYPDKYYNIIDYGAVSDGIHKNTEAFSKAIEACSKNGGGHVIIPAGLWLTGPIRLLSNIDLHLEKGALVVFSEDHSDYPLIKTGGNSYEVMNPIYAEGVENISISGEGIFNGNGQTWRPIKKMKMTSGQWKELTESGGYVNEKGDIWWPTENALNAEKLLASKKRSELTKEDFEYLRDFNRPNLVNISNSKNIFISDVTFQNSPKFAFNPKRCQNMVVARVKVLNEWWAQNGDGLDLSACKNVLMYQCTVNTGDDGICMKSSGKPEDSPALENIVIRDCIVYRAHGGFVIGSNTDGGIKNIFVNNCLFIGTDTGLRFKSGRDKGGKVENIFISDIRMKDITNEAIIFDMYYEDAGAAKTLDKKAFNKIPNFTNISMNGLVCDGAKTALLLNDVPEVSVKSIQIKDAVFNSLNGIKISEGENISLSNISLNHKNGVAFEIADGKNILLQQLRVTNTTNSLLNISGIKTKNIHVSETNISDFKNPMQLENEELKKEIHIK